MIDQFTSEAGPRAADVTAREIMARLDAGDDPRQAIAVLNAEIVAFQSAGVDLPANLMRLTRAIVAGYQPRLGTGRMN